MQAITFTAHALDRMAERNISTATARAVIKHGTQELQSCGSIHCSMDGITIVVDPQPEESVVVTMYDATWKRKVRNKKKRHRMPSHSDVYQDLKRKIKNEQ